MDIGVTRAGSHPAQAQDTWLVYASSGEYPVTADHAALAAVTFMIDRPDDYIAAVVNTDMQPPLVIADAPGRSAGTPLNTARSLGMAFPPPPAVWQVTRPMVEELAGRAVTDAELARIAAAIPHSTIPDALAAVTDGCLPASDTAGREAGAAPAVYPQGASDATWHLMQAGWAVTWEQEPGGYRLTLGRGPDRKAAVYSAAGATMQDAWDRVRARVSA